MRYFWIMLVVVGQISQGMGQQVDVEGLLREFLNTSQHRYYDEQNNLGRICIAETEALAGLKKVLQNRNLPEDLRSWATFLPAKMAPEHALKLLPELHQALRDSSWKVRKNAANTLGIIHSRKTKKELLSALADVEVFVRDSVEYTLQKLLDESDIESIEKRFSHVDADGRRRLLILLGELQTTKGKLLLYKALRDPDPGVRTAAIHYLGQLSPVDFDAIIALAKDPSPLVRERVALICAKSPARKPDTLLFDQDERVRLAAIYSLATIPQLREIASRRDKTKEIAVAILAMSRKNVPKTLLLAKQFLARENIPEYLRATVAYALADLPNVAAAQEIAVHLEDPSELVRNLAISGLLRIAARCDLSPPSPLNSRSHWDNLLQKHAKQIEKRPIDFLPNERTSLHYRVVTNLSPQFLQQTVVMMEFLNIYYRQIFAVRPLVETITEEQLRSREDARKDGNGYVLSSRIRLEFANEDERIIRYPSGKIVEILSKSRKKITTPAGRVIVKQDNLAMDGKQITLRIFQRRREFQEYAKRKDSQWPFLQDSGAYYSRLRSEIITYAKNNPLFVQRTLFHETLHQVLTHHIFDCPIWLNEGLAEYYSNFRSADTGYLMGFRDEKYLRFLREIIRTGQYVPLQNLIRMDHFSFHNDNFGAEETMHYAQSWSLVYFFHHYRDGHFASVLTEYYFALKDEEQPLTSFLRILKKHGWTMEELEKHWKNYYLHLDEHD